jgi:hypothetical protein
MKWYILISFNKNAFLLKEIKIYKIIYGKFVMNKKLC